jgi:hypothetical protein
LGKDTHSVHHRGNVCGRHLDISIIKGIRKGPADVVGSPCRGRDKAGERMLDGLHPTATLPKEQRPWGETTGDVLEGVWQDDLGLILKAREKQGRVGME